MNLRCDLGEVITAMVTPFDENGNINYNQVMELAGYLADNGSDGIVVAGTTGESPTLTYEEEAELLSCVKSAVGDSVKIIIGAGSNSTKTAIECAKRVEKIGADAMLQVVPYYNKPSQSGMLEHFSAIAKSTDMPILLYNIPSRTGVNMQPQTVAELSEFKNIVALKQSNGDLDLISEMKSLLPEDFALYSGDDSLTLPMLALGVHGVVSVASHVAGKEIKSMIRNFKTGEYRVATNMHLKLYPLFKKIFMAPNPVPIKHILSKMGLINPYVRRPLVELNENEAEDLMKVANNYIHEYQK